MRRGISLIELLIVIAIVGLLVGLTLAAVSKTRASSARLACANNLKQVGIAANNHHTQHGAFPPGSSSPAQASSIVHLLPFLEQGALYQKFDMEKSMANAPENQEARTQEVPGLLCPADPSVAQWSGTADSQSKPVGRTSYYANLGAHAWWRNNDPKTAGMFHYSKKEEPVKLSEVADGASNTALYAEVRRGNLRADDPENVWTVSYTVWDEKKDEHDMAPFPECDTATDSYNYRGLQYYRGVIWTSMYTHTVPINYKGRDCMRGGGVDRAHIAARSHHANGVNVLFVDGSVRFLTDTTDADVWRAMGTRSGQDIAE